MEELRNVPPEQEIDWLYTLIRHNPHLLHSIDKQPFVDTLLHFAAREGRTRPALEIQRLMPSFGTKLNPDGWSPLHVALRSGHMDTGKAMVELDPQLVGVQGREGMTPLHYMAERENVDVLAEFLYRCPDSINQLTIDGESAVHVAVRNGNLETVRVLVGWLKRRDNMIGPVLRRKNREGNTVLHLAAETNQPEMIQLLLREKKKHLNEREMDVNDKNLNGLTALDRAISQRAVEILQQKKAKHGRDIPHPRISTFARYLTSPILIMEWIIRMNAYMNSVMSTNTKNSILVVAVLIATATFQTALSPPAGFSNQSPTTNGRITANHNITGDVGNGKLMMEGDYSDFIVVNSIALATSLATMCTLLPYDPKLMFLYMSLLFLMVRYLIAIRATASPNEIESILLSYGAMVLSAFILLVKSCQINLEALLWTLNERLSVSWQVIEQAMNSLTVKGE